MMLGWTRDVGSGKRRRNVWDASRVWSRVRGSTVRGTGME